MFYYNKMKVVIFFFFFLASAGSQRFKTQLKKTHMIMSLISHLF